MPKYNTVLQTEKDIFQREIRSNSHENCHFSTFFRLPKFPNTLGRCPVNIKQPKWLLTTFSPSLIILSILGDLRYSAIENYLFLSPLVSQMYLTLGSVELSWVKLSQEIYSQSEHRLFYINYLHTEVLADHFGVNFNFYLHWDGYDCSLSQPLSNLYQELSTRFWGSCICPNCELSFVRMDFCKFCICPNGLL